MPSVIKAFAKEAKTRKPTRKFEPAHAGFLSSNWNQVKPKITRKSEEDASATSNIVSLDCEFVGVGPDGCDNALARVSIVDYDENVLLDEFIFPEKKVVDYRTKITGITSQHMKSAKYREAKAREVIGELLEGKIVVGHALQNDFRTLQLNHPHHLIRDTSIYRGFRAQDNRTKTPSLRNLSSKFLQTCIQDGVHDSVEDARIALRLYKQKRPAWEKKVAAGKPTAKAEPEDEEVGEKIEREDASKGQKRTVEEVEKETQPTDSKKKKKKKKKAEAEAAESAEKESKTAEDEEDVDADEVDIVEEGDLVEESFNDKGGVSFDSLLGEEKDEMMDLMKCLEASRGFCFKEEKKKKKRNKK